MPYPRLRLIQRAACLALFAMLLLGVGPLLSQLLVPSQAGNLLEADCHDGGSEARQPTGEPREHDGLWAKCGYCVLLLNSPALLTATLSVARHAMPDDGSEPFRRIHWLPGAAVFPDFRSRAPPSFS